MRSIILIIVFCGVAMAAKSQSSFDKMTNQKMNKILLRETSNVKGGSGNWQVTYKEMPLFIITDSVHNRMRIITPVAEKKDLKQQDLELLLEANFDRALDAKYSLFQDVLWSTYTHPLGELTVEQFKDAIRQVARLSQTYGTSYTSTDMVFGGDN
ncbi:MAG: YbjN domain-containing protein [bacterium]|nr:YbjN domain-containing protein [bacterium]